MDKNEVLEKIKKMLEERGKAELKEFAEDMAEIGYECIKIVVEESETKVDDIVLASLDGVIKEYIDKIDGKEG